MAQFRYTALSRHGEKVSGLMEAYNAVDATRRIKEEYGMILKLAEVAVAKPNFMAAEVGGNRLNAKAFTVMCSQFAIILEAGVPLARAVNLIAERTTDKTLKRLLDKVGQDVENGRSISASFAEHGEKLLPVTFIETIHSGEESGNIEKSFESMHEHFDKQAKMAAKVRSAMAYPLFVLVVAIAVVVVLMVAVVPTFMEMFEEFDAQLPLMTRMLIAMSNFFRNNLLVLALCAVGIPLFIKLYGNTEKGRMNLAKIQLKLPILGNIALLTAASQFANSMTTLIDSGLTMNKSVFITSKVLDNYYISQEIGKLTSQLEEGRTLGESMREQQVMPNILIDMTAVGEESGEVAKTLHTVARFYDEELESAIQKALAMMEPALLCTLGVIAGFIVLSVYLAMFTLYDAM